MDVDKIIEEGARLHYGKPDWLYRDVHWCPDSWWTTLINIIEEDNHIILAKSTRRHTDGTYQSRGQILISPQGMENIDTFLGGP